MQTLCRKRLFYITAAVNFLMAAIYCYLTPLMTDDIIYGDTVAKANSFFDLFAQEYEHYMGHSGRSVAHFILRIFLYIGNKNVFNIVAAAAFTLLGILIYLNVDCRKEYDLRVFIGILLLMWLFDPSISNSVFWETGACNYLFTGTLIMGFITIFRNNYREKKHRSIPFAVGMLLYGIVTGWCNENTSGGLIFFIMLMIFLAWLETKDFSGIRLWMVTGFVGNVIGFLFMVFAPGNSSRSAVKADREAHSGDPCPGSQIPEAYTDNQGLLPDPDLYPRGHSHCNSLRDRSAQKVQGSSRNHDAVWLYVLHYRICTYRSAGAPDESLLRRGSVPYDRNCRRLCLDAERGI